MCSHSQLPSFFTSTCTSHSVINMGAGCYAPGINAITTQVPELWLLYAHSGFQWPQLYGPHHVGTLSDTSFTAFARKSTSQPSTKKNLTIHNFHCRSVSAVHRCDKMPELINYKEEIFILTHGFRGLSPWLFSPLP
jgi:hypothetical protein